MTDTSWHSDAYPELRSGPPWVMQEMIAAHRALAEQLLTSPSRSAARIAEAIASALASARPVTVTGCGTSEHAAQAIASLIGGAVAIQAKDESHIPDTRRPATARVPDHLVLSRWKSLAPGAPRTRGRVQRDAPASRDERASHMTSGKRRL